MPPATGVPRVKPPTVLAVIDPEPMDASTPEVFTRTPLAVPPAVTWKGLAVDVDRVFTLTRIGVPVAVEAEFSLKLNALLEVVVKDHCQTCALSPEAMVLAPVAAVTLFRVGALPVMAVQAHVCVEVE